MKLKEVNEKIMALAEARGYNHFNSVGSLDGANYYTLEYFNANGWALPMGLPCLVEEKAGEISVVEGEMALDFLERLFDDE